jgi:hypothetical protein
VAEAHQTEYLVLERGQSERLEPDPGGATASTRQVWVERETLFARSAKDAVARHVKSNGKDGGHFVAVPTRSFSQVKVAAETQTRLTFS